MILQERVKNLQALPENKKKLILVLVVAIVGLILLFFAIQSTRNGITKIGNSLKTVNLPKVDLQAGVKETPKIGFAAIMQGKPPLDSMAYKNEEYGFEISHTQSWEIDKAHTFENKLSIIKKVLNQETAGIHIEVVSQTEKISSAEAGIDAMILKMKEVLVAKKEVQVGEYSGYEAVGTICVEDCAEGKEGAYNPFSITYFSDGNNVFEVQYGEGVMGQGWKDNIINWKYYEEFKQIISTFKYNK